jgi:N utilization substance protein A
MVQTEFAAALNQVAAERGIEPEDVLKTVEAALISAYRKDYGGDIEELKAEVDSETGAAKIFKNDEDVTPAGFGRIAAQTAKQVLLQRVRESEKQAVIEDYQKKIGEILSGHIFRIEKGVVIVDLGRTQGIMPPSEQVRREEYQLNQRLKVLVADVREGPRGPEVIVSRARPEFVEKLFALEVPEMQNGTVKVEVIAREPGERTKIAVSSNQENVDPVGSCVGQKGVRVQAVIAELGEEKIDIIHFSDEADKFIANALSPAKVIEVKLNKKENSAKVEVFEDQLSLAIGKGGQNVRLAAKLTGWKIDIKGGEEERKTEDGKQKTEGGERKKIGGLPTRVANALAKAGITEIEKLKEMTEEELGEIKGIGPKAVAEIESRMKNEE